MINLVIAGNCYDGLYKPIDIDYIVEYRSLGLTTVVESSELKQVNFNLGDTNHLGDLHHYDTSKPFYLTGWIGTTEKTVCRKRYTLDNPYLRVQDIIVDSNLNLSLMLSTDTVKEVYSIIPDVITKSEITNLIYTIYYDSTQIEYETDNSYKEVKQIITDNDRPLELVFKSSGVYKVECEAMGLNNEVSRIEEVILEVNVTGESSEGYRYFIEWE